MMYELLKRMFEPEFDCLCRFHDSGVHHHIPAMVGWLARTDKKTCARPDETIYQSIDANELRVPAGTDLITSKTVQYKNSQIG